MPSRWRLTFGRVDPSRVALPTIHAVVSAWLDDEHHAQLKPYSVSPLRTADGLTSLEVGLLDDRLEGRLRERTPVGLPVRFGGSMTSITKPSELIYGEDWDSLMVDTGRRAWCLRFATPTTFRHANRFSPWPDPVTIIKGLSDRRAQFGPSGPELPRMRRDQLWVTDVDGRNEIVKVRGVTVSGFVGRLRFEATEDAPNGGLIDALVRLAPYSGVGAYTTTGLGVTRQEPTWQPHREVKYERATQPCGV